MVWFWYIFSIFLWMNGIVCCWGLLYETRRILGDDKYVWSTMIISVILWPFVIPVMLYQTRNMRIKNDNTTRR